MGEAEGELDGLRAGELAADPGPLLLPLPLPAGSKTPVAEPEAGLAGAFLLPAATVLPAPALLPGLLAAALAPAAAEAAGAGAASKELTQPGRDHALAGGPPSPEAEEDEVAALALDTDLEPTVRAPPVGVAAAGAAAGESAGWASSVAMATVAVEAVDVVGCRATPAAIPAPTPISAKPPLRVLTADAAVLLELERDAVSSGLDLCEVPAEVPGGGQSSPAIDGLRLSGNSPMPPAPSCGRGSVTSSLRSLIDPTADMLSADPAAPAPAAEAVLSMSSGSPSKKVTETVRPADTPGPDDDEEDAEAEAAAEEEEMADRRARRAFLAV